MPLIKLIQRPKDGWCCNKFCSAKLVGAFKVFQRGPKGYKYWVCLKCFKAMARKSNSNFGRYLPNENSNNQQRNQNQA